MTYVSQGLIPLCASTKAAKSLIFGNNRGNNLNIACRGVMIPAVESIPESDFGYFCEFSDSNSNSNSIPQLSRFQ